MQFFQWNADEKLTRPSVLDGTLPGMETSRNPDQLDCHMKKIGRIIGFLRHNENDQKVPSAAG